MSFAQLNWQKPFEVDQDKLARLQADLPYSPYFLSVCLERNLDTKEAIEEFVEPNPTLFHDPMLMHHMEKAIERIGQAIDSDERILIFGDYDADGITSTTILLEGLQAIGAQVEYYLPNRFTDGYGPNIQVFEEYINKGIQLIITVDCGIAAHEAVAFAMENQVDVIITDHHEIPREIPTAYAVVHPRHPEGNYPFGDLSGAGVTFKLVTALLGEVPIELLDLAAIGTVADLVSLKDENRTIVKQGLLQLKENSRLGLDLLFKKISLKLDEVDETTIGFQIGPRLNALGRLGDASPGVELLTTFDQSIATDIVDLMMQQNSQRQEIVKQITEEALEQVATKEDRLVQIVWGKDWHEGVLGIVASKVVEVTQRPTIVLSIDENKQMAKGSARSIESLDIFKSLQACSSLLEKFGGHHMAAGLSVPLDNLKELEGQVNQVAQKFQKAIESQPSISVTSAIPISDISVSLIKEFHLLKPFGTDNSEPLVEIDDVTLSQIRRLGAEQTHLKLQVSDQNVDLQAIGFGKGSWSERLMVGASISMIGSLTINEWQGNQAAQLIIKDVSSQERMYFDWRSSILKPEHLQVENAIYMINKSDKVASITQMIPKSSQVLLWEDIDADIFVTTNKSNWVILECPINRKAVETVVSYPNNLNTYIIAYQVESATKQGLPSKKECRDVYQYLLGHQQIQVSENLAKIAPFLQIPLERFKLILKMFFEIGFVTIVGGFLETKPISKGVQLEETSAFQEQAQKIWLEKVFIYSNFKDLTKWLG